eukprot:16057-Chlamydomonas_euryale.AAC.1
MATIQHGTELRGMARHGVAWYETALHGVALHGMAWHGMTLSGVAQHMPSMVQHAFEALHDTAWRGGWMHCAHPHAASPCSAHPHSVRPHPVQVFTSENYLANWVQSLFNALGSETAGQTLALGGDGRYFSADAAQTIIKLAAGNGFAKVPAGGAGVRAKGEAPP